MRQKPHDSKIDRRWCGSPSRASSVLLSYLLGAVVLATVINLVAGLGSSSGG
jgi:hypothetical protein